jgi:hypothetical protein
MSNEPTSEITLTDKRSAALEQARPQMDPLLAVMDKLANNPNLDADKIERLMTIFIDGQRKMATMADEIAFANAMADFKKNPPNIVKSKLAEVKKDGVKLYDYRYADLDAYATAAEAGLAERGITWSFPFSEAPNGVITVSCVLRCRLYTHTPTTLSSPPDQTGGKNAIQAKASTITYLERYTFCGATGLTAGMPDTDGTTLTQKPAEAGCLEAGVAADFQSLIEGSGSHEELQTNYFKARDAAAAAKDGDAAKRFAEVKNRIYKKLAKGVRRGN